ncbi:hypothetical protein FZEAL_10939 [Fusarium zealandicum]|uniref:Uncharacterized protein n=1 Tax=Fusarium zealandicum TaxID=1053134 RepID=A0A8H4TSY4_9HYPO|nr:hypothetical protein FZEAL_10939 [Fusarium zealandicum]
MRNLILLSTSLLAAVDAAASSPRQLSERAACNRDNLFRCFIDQKSSLQARQCCQGLLPFTVTVATTTATTAIISTETLTTTTFAETVPTATTTLTLGVGAVAKRQAIANPPKCMTNGVTYPASRITSACSCIDVPASTVSVTHTFSTETVTQASSPSRQVCSIKDDNTYRMLQTETVYTTPLATVTSWETVSKITTGGVFTVTVGPPLPVNRIANGGFETNADGWQLFPDSWTGEVVKPAASIEDRAYRISSSGEGMGELRQIAPIYLEPGRYRAGFFAPLAPAPLSSDAYARLLTFDIVNPAAGTNMTVSSIYARRMVAKGRIVAAAEQTIIVPDEAAGYNQVTLRFHIRPFVGNIDDIFLERA